MAGVALALFKLWFAWQVYAPVALAHIDFCLAWQDLDLGKNGGPGPDSVGRFYIL